MRIVAGQFRGRPLATPRGNAVRPTSDRMRESLFSILAARYGGHLQDARIADLFAGTGALGLEALSRGARQVCFVEQHPASIALVERNIETLGAQEQCRVIRADATRLPRQKPPFDLILLDPPYGRQLVNGALRSTLAQGWAGPDTLMVAECAADDSDALISGLTLLDERQQGTSRLLFLKPD